MTRALGALLLASCGCTELLDADFESPTLTSARPLTVTLSDHPHDATLTGSGQVVSHDQRITCGAQCAAEYSGVVTLTATPDPGSAFAGWRSDPRSDCSDSREPTCTLDVAAATAIEAFFVTGGANLWFSTISGTEADWASAVAAAADGSVYAVGQFRASPIVGGETWTSQGGDDFFVLALEPDGALRRARAAGSPSNDSASDIALTADGPVVVGRIEGIQGGAELDPFGMQSNEGYDAFVAALDPDLNLRWKWFQSTAAVTGFTQVVTDALGRIYVAGSVDGDFQTQLGSDSGVQDIVVLALEANGKERWHALFGGSEAEQISGLAVQSSGELVLLGWSGSGFDMNVRGGDCAPTSAGPFLARITSEGACVAARSFAAGISDASDRGLGIDANDDVIVSGSFSGIADFSGGSDPNAPIDALNDTAGFVVRFGPDLTWTVGRSWATAVTGSAKLGEVDGADGDALLSLMALADVSIGDVPIPYDPGGHAIVARLDASGDVIWTRTYAAPSRGKITDIEWHRSSQTWFMAADFGPHEAASTWSLDFRNVTQTAFEAQSNEAVVARFAP